MLDRFKRRPALLPAMAFALTWALPVSAQQPASPRSFVFVCPAGERIEVTFEREPASRAVVTVKGTGTISLPQARSGSGARYSDGFTTLWNVGNRVLLQAGSINVHDCVQSNAAKPH